MLHFSLQTCSRSPVFAIAAVVVVLSRDFVTKKWPMWELGIALERQQQQDVQRSSFLMLPVLYDLTYEDAESLMHSVYADPRTWQDKQRPDEATLQKWAAWVKESLGVTCRLPDQVCWHPWAFVRCIDRHWP